MTNSEAALDTRYPARTTRVAEIRRDVAEAASVLGAREATLMRIKLAVSEAATNAMLHAYRDDDGDGDVHVLVRRSDGLLEVNIRDGGVGMSPRADSPGMGLGLSLMAHEASHCQISSSPAGGTEVVLRFRLDTAA